MKNTEAQAIDVLILQVSQIVSECGASEGFDAKEWVNRWIRTPLPALNNRTPFSLLGSTEGQRIVSNLLTTAQSGAFL